MKQCINTQVDVNMGEQIKVDVIDKDIARNDLIGSYVMDITAKDWSDGHKTGIKFGAVENFVYFFSSYTNLKLTSLQEEQIRNANHKINTAERYLASRYSASSAPSYIEKAKKDLELLNAEIPHHPKLIEIEQKLAGLQKQAAIHQLQELNEKLKSSRRWYESALQRNDQYKTGKYLEDIKKLMAELPKYHHLEAAKTAITEWNNWWFEEQKKIVQNSTPKPAPTAAPVPDVDPAEIRNARGRLRSILSWSQGYMRSKSYLKKLRKYAEDGKPHVETLCKQKDKHQDLLEQYQQLLDRIQELESEVAQPTTPRPTPVPTLEPTATPKPAPTVAPVPDVDPAEIRNARGRLKNILSWSRGYMRSKSYLNKLRKYAEDGKPHVETLCKQKDKHQDLLEQYQQLLDRIQELESEVAQPTTPRPTPVPTLKPTATPKPAPTAAPVPEVNPAEIRNARGRLRSILSWSKGYMSSKTYLNKLRKYAKDGKPYAETLYKQKDQHQDLLGQYQQLLDRIQEFEGGTATATSKPAATPSPGKAGSAEVKKAQQRLYSILGYARHVKDTCASKTAETENGQRRSLNGAWEALLSLDSKLENGKSWAAILEAHPDQVSDPKVLQGYKELQEFSRYPSQ